jgi:tRNA(Ile2) C34 agmatinyltransferase TiaS
MESTVNPNITQNWSIFSALHDVIKERALKRLRFAECPTCRLLTPYRLKSLEGNGLRCKKCGTTIQLARDDPK